MREKKKGVDQMHAGAKKNNWSELSVDDVTYFYWPDANREFTGRPVNNFIS